MEQLTSSKSVLFCKSPPLKWALLEEKEQLEELEKAVHPRTLTEYKYSPYYVLSSHLGKY